MVEIHVRLLEPQYQQLIYALNAHASGAYNTQPHLPPSLLGINKRATERSFHSHATWVIDVIGFFFDMLSLGAGTNQAPADVRSTGAGIGCLHCSL